MKVLQVGPEAITLNDCFFAHEVTVQTQDYEIRLFIRMLILFLHCLYDAMTEYVILPIR